jgi:hypothetical protein
VAAGPRGHVSITGQKKLEQARKNYRTAANIPRAPQIQPLNVETQLRVPRRVIMIALRIYEYQ